MSQNQKNSAAYAAGSILAWCFIIGIFVGIFYFALYLQKQSLGIYDIEKRLDRLENTIMNKGIQYE
jgi:uncharacterized membrane protein YciS (DUF1049 family)